MASWEGLPWKQVPEATVARRPPGKASPGSRSLVGRESCFHTALFFTAAGELMASSDCETGGEKSLPGNGAGSGETTEPT